MMNRLLLVIFPMVVLLGGCWIEENSEWTNSLDPANPRYTRMVHVPGGTFRIGGDTSVVEAYLAAGAVEHTVRVSGFLMDSTEVTQREWRSLMGTNPSFQDNCEDCPVEGVTWYDAILFCNARSRSQGLDTVYEWSGPMYTDGRATGMSSLRQLRGRNGYRLPTEAEWEYAARGGSDKSWFWGDDSTETSKYGWVAANSGGRTHPVASLKPVGAGFYDLQGNVWEWTSDWLFAYDSALQVDPSGPATGAVKVFRGGCILEKSDWPRNGDRTGNTPDHHSAVLGFRCARSLVP